MKNFKYILLTFCLIASLGAHALRANEASEREYILNHGHSEEIVRMIELQKSRTERPRPEHKKFKNSNRLIKLFKNLFYERDITMPLEKFGQDKMRTVESPDR